jgi:cardiolipin synthase
MNLANWLTLLRLCLVPLVIAAISQHRFELALAGFVIAGLTDAIDGYVARNFNQMTELGAILDPIADKSLLMSIFVTLGILGIIPIWLVIIVVARDLMIMGAVVISWLLDNPVAIRPIFVSKANTAAQIVFAAYKLGTLAFQAEWPTVDLGLMSLVCLLTIASMAAYLASWLRHMTQ